eukprot:g859.t1
MGQSRSAGADGAAAPTGSTNSFTRFWDKAHRDTVRTAQGAVPLLAAGARLATHFATGVAGDILESVEPDRSAKTQTGDLRDGAAPPSGTTSSSARETLSSIRNALLENTDRLETAAREKLREVQGMNLHRTDSGDFVHEDAAAESAFRIFEALPRFIGPLREHRSPNKVNAAVLHYIDLQKKFLRQGWERHVELSVIDKMIRRVVLGIDGSVVEQGPVAVGSANGNAVIADSVDANAIPIDPDYSTSGGARAGVNRSSSTGAQAYADYRTRQMASLPAPLFPVECQSGAGTGANTAARQAVVQHGDLAQDLAQDVVLESFDTTQAMQVDFSIENERRVRTFLSRSMNYCHALYRACLIDFRDSLSRLDTYFKEDGVRNTEIITAELTAKPFLPAHAILLDHEDKAVVVVVRGTLSGSDVLTDLISDAVEADDEHEKRAIKIAQDDEQDEKQEDVMFSPRRNMGDVDAAMFRSAHEERHEYRDYVHEGMYKSAKNLSNALAEPVLRLLKQHDYRKVVLTGHSLGAGTSALLYSLWESQPGFRDVDLFGAAHACPPVCSLEFTKRHYCARMRTTCGQEGATSGTTERSGSGSRFFAATVVGWDVVPRLSQAAVLNLRRCVDELCDLRVAGSVGGVSGSAAPETDVGAVVSSLALWNTLKAAQKARMEDEDNGVPQLLVPGEKVFFLPFEMESRAVWQPPDFFDEIILSARMLKTHMPGAYASGLRAATLL